MIDKEKSPQLYKATEETIQRRINWLREALECQLLCELLPEEIKCLSITNADKTGNSLSISITNKEGTVPTLKILGIQGLKPQVSSFDKSRFYSQGKGVLPNGNELLVYLSNMDKPEGCRVDEKTVTHTENVLVCEETGKPI